MTTAKLLKACKEPEPKENFAEYLDKKNLKIRINYYLNIYKKNFEIGDSENDDEKLELLGELINYSVQKVVRTCDSPLEQVFFIELFLHALSKKVVILFTDNITEDLLVSYSKKYLGKFCTYSIESERQFQDHIFGDVVYEAIKSANTREIIYNTVFRDIDACISHTNELILSSDILDIDNLKNCKTLRKDLLKEPEFSSNFSELYCFSLQQKMNSIFYKIEENYVLDSYCWFPFKSCVRNPIFEVDGYEWHSTKEAFIRDRKRDRALNGTAIVYRFSGSEVYGDLKSCVTDVLKILRAYEHLCHIV